MTNAQKWISAFLGIFLVLFVIGRLTKEDDKLHHLPNSQYSEQTQAAEAADGLTLMKQNGCITCHGQDLTGTNMAPALVNIKEHWSRDGLINYLRNPSSYSGDSRFEEYRMKYKNIVMPSYGNLDVKDLGIISDYLLTK